MTTNNPQCKLGGCSAIGCEGGHYCFTPDGQRKAPSGTLTWPVRTEPSETQVIETPVTQSVK